MAHRVAVLALHGVFPFDLGIPDRVLREAHDLKGRQLYDIRTCSIGGRPVRTNHDFSITVDYDEALLGWADTVVVATQEPGEELLKSGNLTPEVDAALRQIRPDARIVSLCTAAFVLAASGMLDGQAATTHWMLCSQLAATFPRISVDPDVLFVDNGRILTSAGGAAGIDLCLHLVRRDFGADAASAAARRCVVAPWRDGGQAQFIDRPLPVGAADSTADIRIWSLANIGVRLTVDEMARRSHMSVRTFSRRFQSEVGMSPGRWLLQQRVDHSRRLLESTDFAIEEVAARSGFSSDTLLRKHLRDAVGLSPTAYRRAFGARSQEQGRQAGAEPEHLGLELAAGVSAG